MIVIGTPVRDTVHVGYAFDLVALVRRTPDVVFPIVKGTLLCNSRAMIAESALVAGASHILFIDSDMRFPADVAERLLLCDMDIVAVNCKQRTQDEWTARKDGKFISSDGRSGLEEVDTVGFGVMLVKIEVFASLQKPWFDTPYDFDTCKHVGEDVYFCTTARFKGYKIFIDHDLSREIGHIGEVEHRA